MSTLDSANKREILDYITKYPADIGHVVGFKDFTDLHNVWLKKMIVPKEDFTIQAHRGSYKTTCLSEAIALRMILYPHENIIFMRKTSNDVVEVIKQVSKILHSDCFEYLFHRIYGRNMGFVGESNTSITINNYDTTRGAAQLLGIGTVGSITGKHSDCVITDDIINLQDRISTAERNRIKGIYQELQNIRNRGGVIINTGTPWHPDDAFSLMPNIVKYDCYSTGLISESALDKLRKSMSPSLFAANYELKHIASENALFDTQPNYISDELAKNILRRSEAIADDLLCDGIAHIDAAYGGTDGTAFTCGKRRGDKIYLYGKIWQKHFDRCIDEAIEYARRFRCAPFLCEDADKGFVQRELKARNIAARTYHEKDNKFVKISTYLRKWWQDIVWHKDTDKEYIAQIMDYTENAEHDDAPDSAACVARYFDKHGGSSYLSPFGG